jgi:hypothetical protein
MSQEQISKQEEYFDDWFSDNKDFLVGEYIEENNDDFMEFVRDYFNRED